MKKYIIVELAVAVLIILGVLAWPAIREYQYKNKVYTDIEEKIDKTCSLTIGIIKEERHDDSAGYNVGSSGVIIKREGNIYYALTAYHVVEEQKDTSYLVRIAYDETLSEFLHRNHKNICNYREYYQQLSVAEVLYTYEEADLAIVSFKSEKELEVAKLANHRAKKDDRIGTIGVDGERNRYFVKHFGEVLTSDLSKFDTGDSHFINIVQYHNAYIVPGYSGSGVFNENGELVGINIGAETGIMERFKRSAMISVDQIWDFVLMSKL